MRESGMSVSKKGVWLSAKLDKKKIVPFSSTKKVKTAKCSK